MSEVPVRNLEPWVVEMLRDQAQRAGCSLEGFLRERRLLRFLLLDRRVGHVGRRLVAEVASTGDRAIGDLRIK